jgi:hypothetical protein
VNIPLVLITLPGTSKAHKIFKQTSLSYIAIRIEAYKTQLVSHSVTTANNSAISELTASSISIVCGVGAVTCTRNARKRAIHYRY